MLAYIVYNKTVRDFYFNWLDEYYECVDREQMSVMDTLREFNNKLLAIRDLTLEEVSEGIEIDCSIKCSRLYEEFSEAYLDLSLVLGLDFTDTLLLLDEWGSTMVFRGDIRHARFRHVWKNVFI